MGKFEDDDDRITRQLDRDFEREPRRLRVTLIPKAAGVLQPLLPVKPTKNGGGR